MVYLKLSSRSIERLQAGVRAAESAPSNSKTDARDEEVLTQLKGVIDDGGDGDGEADHPPRGVVSHDVLVAASTLLRRPATKDGVDLVCDYDLDVLLRGARLWYKPKPKYVRPPSLDARLAQIRLQQEEASYLAMSGRGGDPSSTSTLSYSPSNTSDSSEWLEIRRQLSALVNILFSAVGLATATWWSLGEYTALHIKMAACLVSATGIVAIEAFLYARHFQRMQEKREWRRRVRVGKLTVSGGGGGGGGGGGEGGDGIGTGGELTFSGDSGKKTE